MESKTQQAPTHLEGMMKDAVEVTFIESLACELADVNENKKQEMYMLMKDVIFDVMNCHHIQAHIGRLSKGRLIKKKYLKVSASGHQRLFFDEEDIMEVLVERLQNKACMVVSY